jgi:hypothetical protein
MQQKYISLDDAAKKLNITRPTLYYYIRKFNLETKKFPLDKKAYLLMSDFEYVKGLKDEANERGTYKEGESKGANKDEIAA